MPYIPRDVGQFKPTVTVHQEVTSIVWSYQLVHMMYNDPSARPIGTAANYPVDHHACQLLVYSMLRQLHRKRM